VKRLLITIASLTAGLGHAEIYFDLNFENINSAGVTWNANQISVVTQAANEWGSLFAQNYTIDVDLTFTRASTSGYLGQWAGGYAPGTTNGDNIRPWENTVHEIRFNADLFDTSLSHYLWWDDDTSTDIVAGNQWDALSVARHEFGHLLGFSAGFYVDVQTGGVSAFWEDLVDNSDLFAVLAALVIFALSACSEESTSTPTADSNAPVLDANQLTSDVEAKAADLKAEAEAKAAELAAAAEAKAAELAAAAEAKAAELAAAAEAKAAELAAKADAQIEKAKAAAAAQLEATKTKASELYTQYAGNVSQLSGGVDSLKGAMTGGLSNMIPANVKDTYSNLSGSVDDLKGLVGGLQNSDGANLDSLVPNIESKLGEAKGLYNNLRDMLPDNLNLDALGF
tara:strand:- start:2495 stop:3685 length:1191 start_codon:yes stop_codon:yes gene_type:complete